MMKPKAPRKATKLFYIDDSGSTADGYSVYAWISFYLEDWTEVLSRILFWRKSLWENYQIPSSYELHLTKFANGRGNPSQNDDWNRSKENRSEVVNQAFSMIAGLEELVEVGAVFSRTFDKRKRYALDKERLYQELITTIDETLTNYNELGIIMMDGDGTDESYTLAHRDLTLSARSIVEDPLFQNSRLSQPIQIADFLAYAAYQCIIKAPKKEFAWNWYPSLVEKGVASAPKQL